MLVYELYGQSGLADEQPVKSLLKTSKADIFPVYLGLPSSLCTARVKIKRSLMYVATTVFHFFKEHGILCYLLFLRQLYQGFRINRVII